ncbi:MAG: putative transposase, partial [Paraglaciecola sp.]
MCRVLMIARAGFYFWLHKPLSDKAIEDTRLLKLIKTSYDASHGIYGANRVVLDLKELGEQCGRNRVAKIMRNHGIKALRGYKAPRVIQGRPSIVAPNRLERGFTINTPDTVWVTDIT